VLVGVLVADCVPVVLVNSSRRRCALVHAGWRGLAAGVIARALESLGDPRDVVAAIGPSISRERYEVGPEVAQHFRGVDGALVAGDGDRSRLDLHAVTRHQLVAGAVDPDSIWTSLEVTDGGERFFSDRAQRPCGRFALVAKWSS